MTTYGYDALGNLRSVALPDGRLIEHVIDGMNRRISKKINGAVVQGWLYGGGVTPVAELDGSGALVSRIVVGGTDNGALYVVKGATTYRVVSDRLGTPRVIVDVSTGVVDQALDTDETGKVVSDSASGFQPLGFAGGVYDPDTGLTRFGGRDYDASVGRWVSKDLIGFAGGSSNLYVYAKNDPVDLRDPSGIKFVVTDPDALAVLAHLAGQELIGPYIDAMEASDYLIVLLPSSASDVLTYEGGAYADTSTPGGAIVRWDLEAALNWTDECGKPHFSSLYQLLAHELGHVTPYAVPDVSYVGDMSYYSNLFSVEFEDIARGGAPYRMFH